MFSTQLRDPKDVEKVMEDCMVWGRNQGETHLAMAAKPLIKKYFEGKVKRETEKQARYDQLKEKMGVD